MSVREAILQRIVSIIEQAVQTQGVRVTRQPLFALSMESGSRLIVIEPEGETLDRANDRCARSLALRIAAVVAGTFDQTHFETADALASTVHRALLANRNLDGLALGISEEEVRYGREGIDLDVAMIETRYIVRYRTLVIDWEQQA